MLGSTSNNLNLTFESRTNSFVYCPFDLLLNRITTMDHDMLAAMVMSTSTKTCRIVVKFAVTANTAVATVNVKNANTKVILLLLETFVHKHGQNSLACDIIVDSGHALARFGLPAHLINVFCHLYTLVRMKFKSGKQIHKFLNLVGVKQKDNLAPSSSYLLCKQH